jgi:hypothetical protein
MMTNKLYHFLTLSLLLGSSYQLSAQCPSSISASAINNVAANCPSSGSIRIATHATGGTLSYMLLDGPGGAATNVAQDDSNFYSLPAGTYKARVFCKVNPAIADSVSFTILDNYTPFGNAVLSSRSGCSGSGLIRVESVAGGRAPLQYALSTKASYPAGLGAYQSIDSFSSLAAGAYIVRIKDACNEYINKEIEIAPPLPAPKVFLATINDQPCANNTYSFQVVNGVNPLTNTSVDFHPYYENGNGLILNVYATDGNCNKGALLATYDPQTAGSVYFQATKASEYWLESVTNCGETYGYCTSADSGPLPSPFIDILTSSSGCGTAGSPAVMNIVNTYSWLTRWLDTVTVEVKNSTGVAIAGSPFKFTSAADFNNALKNLPHDNYTIKATDACGSVLLNRTIQDITGAGSPAAAVVSYSLNCNTQVGTTNATIRMSGYIPNLSNADSIKFISGPSNTGINGGTFDKATGDYYWTNVIPGNYVLRIYTSCDSTTLSVHIPGITLQRYIRAKATSFCTGNGKVAADSTVYNGSGLTTYILIRTTDNARLDSNITGSFTNLPTGTYKIAMQISGYCSSDINAAYEVYSNTVAIIEGGMNPQIVKKIVVTCENASGGLLPTGSLFLNLAGPSPLFLEYIDSSAASPSWITASINAATTETISGLNASHTYYVRVSGCTGGTAIPVTFGRMTPVAVTNAVQPCSGAPYTLSVPEMPGAAYVWTNPAGTIVSTGPDYEIISYNASYNGTYTCAVSFGDCLTRTAMVTLNSASCGVALPIHLTSFAASNKNCTPELNWTAVYNISDRDFTVERSKDGQHFTAVATLPVASQANASYHYTDATSELNNGNLYYRLKLTDLDGSATYSATEMVRGCSNNQPAASGLSVNPNPARSGQMLQLSNKDGAFDGNYSIVTTSGQTLVKNALRIGEGNTVSIPMPSLEPGIYMIVLTDKDHKVVERSKIVVY